MSRRAEQGHFLPVLHKATLGALAFFLLVAGMTFAGSASAAKAKVKGSRVLVLPFQVHADQPDATSDAEFTEMLARRIGAQGVTVVPQAEMRKALGSKSASSLDAAAVRRLAAATGASHVVYGSVNQVGTAMSVDARMVSTDASEPPKPMFVEQKSGQANLGYAMDELAGAVANELPPPPLHPIAAEGSAAEAQRPGKAVGIKAGGIAGVEVRGTKVLDPDVVMMRISTRRGDRPDATSIDQDIKQIWDLGYFSDVSVNTEQRSDGTHLVYTVVERPKVDTIVVNGTDELDEDDITSAMATKPGSILSESVLADDITKILELYRKKGFYLAKVDTAQNPSSNGTTNLVLNIKEGKQLYIKEVRIDGITELDEDDVKDQLMLTERGILSWITGKGILREELIERDSSVINAYYLDRGYMDITVASPKIDYEDDGIRITFPVHEGPKYKLGNVSYNGDLIVTEDKLRNVTKVDKLAAEGGYFNLTAMQEDAKALTELYSDEGYAFADVNARPKKHMDSDTVDIEYVIEKKNKVYVRRVLVEGNTKTRDNVILREMRLTDGEQFDGAKLRRSTDRLNRLGYFEVAEAELVPTENDEEVDLKVKVKEKPTGALMAGVGYSTFSSVGVSATIMERNLWGKGYQLSLQAAFSGRRDAYTITFTNPRVNDTNLSFTGEAYHWRDDYIDYVKKTTGGVIRFGYPIGEYTAIQWGYRLDRYKIYDLEDDASNLIRKYAYDYRFTSVGLARIHRDSTRMDGMVPINGNIDSFGIEYGGGLLGGDDDFITLSAEHHSYYQIKPSHVLHGRVKAQTIFNNGSDEVPVFERFWMGGMNSVRGYNSRDIVPRDKKTGDRIGGTRMAFANLEYIYTLNNDLGLFLVPFFDVGFNIDDDHDFKWSDEIKKSAGLELRWRSPMGDLRFSYGIPFDEDRKGDKKGGRFEFSMGQMF